MSNDCSYLECLLIIILLRCPVGLIHYILYNPRGWFHSEFQPGFPGRDFSPTLTCLPLHNNRFSPVCPDRISARTEIIIEPQCNCCLKCELCFQCNKMVAMGIHLLKLAMHVITTRAETKCYHNKTSDQWTFLNFNLVWNSPWNRPRDYSISILTEFICLSLHVQSQENMIIFKQSCKLVSWNAYCLQAEQHYVIQVNVTCQF